MTRGNSKTTASSGSIVSERKGDQNEVSLGLEGNYGQTEETQSDGTKQMKTTVQNEKGYAKYRRLFTDRDYAYFNGELSQDKIADIKYRLIIGPGLGRYFIKSDKTTLGGEAGISWIKDKVGDVEGDRFALRVAQRYEWKISDTAKIWENVEYIPALDDFNNYLVNGEIGAEAAMNAKFSLRIVAQTTTTTSLRPATRRTISCSPRALATSSRGRHSVDGGWFLRAPEALFVFPAVSFLSPRFTGSSVARSPEHGVRPYRCRQTMSILKVFRIVPAFAAA